MVENRPGRPFWQLRCHLFPAEAVGLWMLGNGRIGCEEAVIIATSSAADTLWTLCQGRPL